MSGVSQAVLIENVFKYRNHFKLIKKLDHLVKKKNDLF